MNQGVPPISAHYSNMLGSHKRNPSKESLPLMGRVRVINEIYYHTTALQETAVIEENVNKTIHGRGVYTWQVLIIRNCESDSRMV